MRYGLLNGAFLLTVTQLFIVLKNATGSTTFGAFGPTFRLRDRPDLVPVINNLHTKWYIDAVDALVGAYAKKALKEATGFSKLSHASCLRTVTEISGKAKCLHKEIVRQEQQIRLKHSLNLFRRRYSKHRMKRKVIHRNVMDEKSRGGHDLINVYKNGFLNGALRQFNERKSADVQSPLQALSTLVINAYHGSEQVGKRDSFSTTLSKLNSLQTLLSNEFPVKINGTALDNRIEIQKLLSMQSKRTVSPAPFSLSSSIPTSTEEKTFKPKVSPIKMERLHSLGEASPLASLLSRPDLWKMNGKLPEAFSPRVAPLFKKLSKIQNRFLSPSVLSFYRDSAADNIASIPEMMDKVGMPAGDQEALLEMMLELSGASKTINSIFDVVNQKNRPSKNLDLEQQVGEATARIESTWADVYRSFSFEQHLDFERDGYTFLRRDQLEKLYGDNGLYKNSTKFTLDLDDYEKWTDKDRDEFLKRAVQKLASNKTKTKQRRVKKKASRSNSKGTVRRGKRQYPLLKGEGTSSGASVHKGQLKQRRLYCCPALRQANSKNENNEAERPSLLVEENTSIERNEGTDAQSNAGDEEEKEISEEKMEGSKGTEERENEGASAGEDEKGAEGDEGNERNEKDGDEKESDEKDGEEKKSEENEGGGEEESEEEKEGEEKEESEEEKKSEEEKESKESEEEEDEGEDTTLEPFAFVVSNLQPSILGPVTLSPNIFSPANLSPALLGPTILSPSLGNPAILSPYVLSPVILSPSVLAPSVLSPYVLSPNIINFIVLCPNILSPFVLSPSIYSPQLFSSNILSPYALSPSYFSDDVADNGTFQGSPDIFSPNILSK